MHRVLNIHVRYRCLKCILEYRAFCVCKVGIEEVTGGRIDQAVSKGVLTDDLYSKRRISYPG